MNRLTRNKIKKIMAMLLCFALCMNSSGSMGNVAAGESGGQEGVSVSETQAVSETSVLRTQAAPGTNTTETNAPETSAPQTSAPETSEPETNAPETSEPETNAPETSELQTSAPETSEPETNAPETSAPQTNAPETSEPKTNMPETSAPQTSAPEISTPQTNVRETNVPETSVPETVPDSQTEVETVYELYINHILEADGVCYADYNVGPVKLYSDDFAKGSYDVLWHAYKKEGIAVTTKSLALAESDFADGTYTADIYYEVADGYRLEHPFVMTRSIYLGSFDSAVVTPIETITVKLKYLYSETSALAGMTAHDTQEIVLSPEKDGTYKLDWELPEISDAYYAILDEEPLDHALADDQLEKAWSEAREKTIDGIKYTYIYDTNGQKPDHNHLKAEGLKKVQDGLEITVYYRRGSGTYTVRHKLVDGTAGGTLIKEQTNVYGRIGALTNAQPLSAISPDDAPFYTVRDYSQEIVEADGSTVVTIWYDPADYQIIFYTGGGSYIPRQHVAAGKKISLPSESLPGSVVPTKKGYTFKGWTYTTNNGQAVSLADDEVTADKEFLKTVKIEEAEGVKTIVFDAVWEPDVTSVRVILWTENVDSTSATNDGSEPVTKNPDKDISAFYNAGHFELSEHQIEIKTGDELVDKNGKLKADIQKAVDEEFKKAMNTTEINGIEDISVFYHQHDEVPFKILTGEQETTEAAADGSTVINVYYERNVYTLKFIYYMPDRNGEAQLCQNTVPISQGGNPLQVGRWETISESQEEKLSALGNVTIKGKYGADLRNIWPSTTTVINATDSNAKYQKVNYYFISWATTAGLYNDRFQALAGISDPKAESTVMGVYGAMGSDIIADPANPETVHTLYAYWFKNASYYRYNYCLEIPGMSEAALEKALRIDTTGEDTFDSERNVLYLVPRDEDIFKTYGFTDLMTVDEKGNADAGGRYYAVRAYEGAYYAVTRQVQVKSTDSIARQTPSARLHLTRVNGTADYNTKYSDNSGVSWRGDAIGTEDAPYDLYYYYTRDRYEITYMVNDRVLGTLVLPYGAVLDETIYGLKNTDGTYRMDSGMKNTEMALENGWEPAGETSVCPDRLSYEAESWIFKGWSLGQVGTKPMTWASDGNPVILESNLLLYARWEVPEYRVSFNLNGGMLPVTQTEDILVQNIKSGHSVSENGQIPRPSRTGYTLTGWKITGCETYSEVIGTDFDFNMSVGNNVTVTAQWESDGIVRTSYTVRYVTVEDGNEVEIADAKIRPNYEYQENDPRVVERPAVPTKDGYEDYVPTVQNATLVLKPMDESKDNVLTFYYTKDSGKQYTVRYVNQKNQTEVVYSTIVKTGASSLSVYPRETDIEAIGKKGFYLTDAEGNRAENAAKLAQDNIQPGTNAADTVITFYVLPETYTISYENVSGYEKLFGSLGNPTSYAYNDTAVMLKNPQSFTRNGQRYEFLGWKLGTGTKIKVGDTFVEDTNAIYSTITVEPGTIGNLTFEAQWSPAIEVGDLTVSKTVTGNKSDVNQEFTFTVSLKDAVDNSSLPGTYSYTGSKNGQITDGGTVTLKHGQSIIIKDVLAGTKYFVAEKDVTNGVTKDYYKVTAAGDTGTIEKGQTMTAAFTNAKDLEVTVHKTVTDKDGKALADDYKAAVGDVLQYQITVFSNADMTDVAITDNIKHAADGKAETVDLSQAVITSNKAGSEPSYENGRLSAIAQGETITFTYTYTVVNSDKELTNVVLLEGTEKDKITVPVENHHELSLCKEVTYANGTTISSKEKVKEGTVLTYKVMVSSAASGNEVVTNVTVTDIMEHGTGAEDTVNRLEGAAVTSNLNKTRTYENGVLNEIEPGETVTLTYHYTVVGADVKLTNTASLPNDITVPDSKTETEVEHPEINVTKTFTDAADAAGNPYAGNYDTLKAGDRLLFTITVKNTGNVELKNIRVTDQMSSDARGAAAIEQGRGYTVNEDGTAAIDKLASGEFVDVKVTYVVDADDPAEVENTARAEGRTEKDTQVEDEDTVEAPSIVKAINVKKQVTGVDADGRARVGDVLTYKITVKNTGNTRIESITVTDKLEAAGTIRNVILPAGVSRTEDGKFLIDSLEAGEESVIIYSYTVQLNDKGHRIRNVAEASRKDSGDPGDTDEVVTEIQNPGLSVEKIILGTPKNGDKYALNEEIYYRVTVINTGNIDLTDISAEDSLVNLKGGSGFKLAAGKSKVFEYTYKVTEDDVKAGRVHNEAVVSIDDPNLASDIPEVKAEADAEIEKAKDTSKDASKARTAKTGDATPLTLWIIICMVSLLAAVFLLFRRRRRGAEK